MKCAVTASFIYYLNGMGRSMLWFEVHWMNVRCPMRWNERRGLEKLNEYTLDGWIEMDGNWICGNIPPPAGGDLNSGMFIVYYIISLFGVWTLNVFSQKKWILRLVESTPLLHFMLFGWTCDHKLKLSFSFWCNISRFCNYGVKSKTETKFTIFQVPPTFSSLQKTTI